MGTDNEFNSVFDYTSAFDYGAPSEINNTSYRRNNFKSVFSYQAIRITSDDEVELQPSKESLPFVVLRNFIVFLFYVVAFALFPVSYWICVKKVNSLERIVLMRLGKLQPVRGPGYALILPFVDKWMKVDLRSQNFTVSTSQLLTADGGVVEAKTDIEYRVSDVISYVLKLERQESTLRDLGLFCLTNIVSEKDQEDLESKRDLISCCLKDELNRSFINWGLEVVSVYLHSVKILKAAEPVDAVGTLINAIKAAAGGSSQHIAATVPLIPDLKGNVSDSTEKHEDCVSTINALLNRATKEGLLNDLNAVFKFDVVGRSTKTILVSFNKGNVSIAEDVDNSVHSDVQLMLTEDNLKDFLRGEASPLEAYMDGKVMVTGDWSLLRSLTKVFDLCKST